MSGHVVAIALMNPLPGSDEPWRRRFTNLAMLHMERGGGSSDPVAQPGPDRIGAPLGRKIPRSRDLVWRTGLAITRPNPLAWPRYAPLEGQVKEGEGGKKTKESEPKG